MYTNQNNFDWSCTNRELVVYVPSYKRKHLLVPTLRRFKTEISRDRWMWLVVNDGIHENLSDLEDEFNIKWFTFERNSQKERGSILLRNYIVKRVQSRLIGAKDPEIIIEGDYIKKVINLEDSVYRTGKMIELCIQDTQKILDNPFIDLTKLQILREWNVDQKMNQAFQANCVMSVKRLRDIGAYDERYGEYYGYEDWQLLERLRKCNIPIIIDSDIICYHIAHPIMFKHINKGMEINGHIYKQDMLNLEIIANAGKEWGNGI